MNRTIQQVVDQYKIYFQGLQPQITTTREGLQIKTGSLTSQVGRAAAVQGRSSVRLR